MYRQIIDVSDVLEPTIVFCLSMTFLEPTFHDMGTAHHPGIKLMWARLLTICRIYVYVYIRLCGAWGNMGFPHACRICIIRSQDHRSFESWSCEAYYNPLKWDPWDLQHPRRT